MKRLIAVLLVAGAAFASIGVSAGAGSSQTLIGIGVCAGLNNGSMTVPAGTAVVVRAGWGAKNRGLIQDWLSDVTTAAAIDGTAVPNPDSLWTAPAASGGNWFTWQYYSFGTLAEGQSVTLDLDWTLNHALWDGVTYNPDGSHQIAPAGVNLISSIFGHTTCTVTGV